MDPNSPLTLTAADGASATIYPQGAHVSSWRCSQGTEHLFLSDRSHFAPGHAIRGGVPVIFPQFADQGPLAKHGFARTQPWTLLEHQAGFARWGLTSNAATLALWPHPFVCELAVRIGGNQLQIELTVSNSGTGPMPFTAALHSYLRVHDIAQVRVAGLQSLRYRDKVLHNAEFIERSDELAIAGEVDRIYFDSPGRVQMIEGRRVLQIAHRGFTDTVIWNPGERLGASLSDLEVDGYRRMLCVESASIGRPVQLAPGERWAGVQTLQAG